MEVRLPDAYALPQNLQQWIDKHKADFQPPVGNKMMSGVSSQFKIMLVAGPNTRTDYHIEDGEEFFYMLKGDMVLKIVDGGRFRDVPIREGEAFLLPARVPHSPQRFADTMGLVIERVRAAGEMDTLRWYCPRCRHILHQQSFPCTDLGKQLAPVIRAYYASDAMRTCRRCGCVDLPAGQSPDYGSAHIEAQYDADELALECLAAHPCAQHDHAHPPAFASASDPARASLPSVCPVTHSGPHHLASWIDANRARLAPPVGNALLYGPGCEFKVMLVGGPNTRTDFHIEDGEEWFYQLQGDMNLKVVDLDGRACDLPIRQGDCFLLPPGIPHSPQRLANTVGLVIERERHPSEIDKLRWYCRNGDCRHVVYEKSFHCTDLGKQLAPVIQGYYASSELRTCAACGAVDSPPAAAAAAAAAGSAASDGSK